MLLNLQSPEGYRKHLRLPTVYASYIPPGSPGPHPGVVLKQFNKNEDPLGAEPLSLNWRAELLFQTPEGYSDLVPSLTCFCEP